MNEESKYILPVNEEEAKKDQPTKETKIIINLNTMKITEENKEDGK